MSGDWLIFFRLIKSQMSGMEKLKLEIKALSERASARLLLAKVTLCC